MPKHIRGIPALLGAAVLLAAVLLAACSPSATPGPTSAANPTAAGSSTGTGAGAVTVTEEDGKITPSTTTAAAGPVSFAVTNSGTLTHEFVVIKTDLPADQLPTTADGSEVDESATGLTVVDEVEDISVGATENLDVTLDAGHYVLICNVPTHYGLGMHVDFTVQ